MERRRIQREYPPALTDIIDELAKLTSLTLGRTHIPNRWISYDHNRTNSPSSSRSPVDTSVPFRRTQRKRFAIAPRPAAHLPAHLPQAPKVADARPP